MHIFVRKVYDDSDFYFWFTSLSCCNIILYICWNSSRFLSDVLLNIFMNSRCRWDIIMGKNPWFNFQSCHTTYIRPTLLLKFWIPQRCTGGPKYASNSTYLMVGWLCFTSRRQRGHLETAAISPARRRLHDSLFL